MKYHNDIEVIENKTPTDDDIRGADLTWDFILEQIGKPRFRDTGLRKTRFSLIGESLSKNRRKKR